MRLLITGSQGTIGQVTTATALAAGYDVRSFDLAACGPVEWEHIPGSILDPVQVRRAVMGCDAVVHLAAIANDMRGNPDLVFTTNVTGTWNLLEAAAEVGMKKFVFFSSIQALGLSGGITRIPDSLPVTDAHPCYPVPAYGLSKHVGEEMCESFTRRHGFSTYCLRPCSVTDPEMYERWRRWNATRERDWSPGDLEAYVDVRDVASAVLRCLEHGDEGKHGRYLLSAAENGGGWDTEEIIRKIYAELPRVGPADYFSQPRRSLIDSSAAREELGWTPEYSWESVG